MNGGKITLLNRVSENMSLYMSVAKGYKQGGFNLGTGLNGSSFLDIINYSPEYLTNYEFGLNKFYVDSRTFI